MTFQSVEALDRGHTKVPVGVTTQLPLRRILYAGSWPVSPPASATVVHLRIQERIRPTSTLKILEHFIKQTQTQRMSQEE